MKLPASKLISAPCASFVSAKATPSVWGKDPLLCGLITLLLSLLPSILVVLTLFLISQIPSSTIICSGTFAVYPASFIARMFHVVHLGCCLPWISGCNASYSSLWVGNNSTPNSRSLADVSVTSCFYGVDGLALFQTLSLEERWSKLTWPVLWPVQLRWQYQGLLFLLA